MLPALAKYSYGPLNWFPECKISLTSGSPVVLDQIEIHITTSMSATDWVTQMEYWSTKHTLYLAIENGVKVFDLSRLDLDVNHEVLHSSSLTALIFVEECEYLVTGSSDPYSLKLII